MTGPKSKVRHYGQRRSQLWIAVLALAMAAFLWHTGDDHSRGVWVGMLLLGLLAARALLFSDACFDLDHGVLDRRWKLLGVLTVFRRPVPLGQFHQVCWLQSARNEMGEWLIWVGLERFSGSPVYVNCFTVSHQRIYEEAKQFAVELSKMTHLPLSPEIDANA